jgi:molybdopterin/thiamine biosynthesis adenylyltransferase
MLELNDQSIYQRQEELKGWDQNLISNLKCLVLGVGGLGTNIAMNLCRLGVKEISILDYDTVEFHNLNRQILYDKTHIGKNKVDSAKKMLEKCHINDKVSNNTQIITYNLDALKSWLLVTKLISEVDIVYNTIDYGDYFDVAVSLACIKYNKLMVLGGTEPFYGHTISYFLQGNRTSDPKYLDSHDLSNKNIIEKIKNEIDKDDISFIPKDSHPIVGGSTVYSAGTCSHLMVASTINYLLALKDKSRCFPKYTIIMNLIDMSFVGWSFEDYK